LSPNLELVRELFAALERRDPAAAAALVAPACEWGPTAWSGGRPFIGRAGVGEWMAQFGENLEHLRVELVELEQHGDRVIALGTVFDGRDGNLYAARVAWLFEVESGLIRKGCGYQTWEEARVFASASLAGS
jgi:ketosteroid isomerase-like protein